MVTALLLLRQVIAETMTDFSLLLEAIEKQPGCAKVATPVARISPAVGLFCSAFLLLRLLSCTLFENENIPHSLLHYSSWFHFFTTALSTLRAGRRGNLKGSLSKRKAFGYSKEEAVDTCRMMEERARIRN